MNLRVLYIVALICLGLGPQVVDAKKPQIRIAVIGLEAKTGVDPSIAELMSDILRTELYNSGRFAVMNREDMDIILKEIAFQQSGACDETSCIVQMGQALGVGKMVAGTIGILGGKYVINAKLINVESFTNEVLVTEFTPVESKDGPQQTFRSVAWQLAGLRKPKFKSLDENRNIGLYITIGTGSMVGEAIGKQSIKGVNNSVAYSIVSEAVEFEAHTEYLALGLKVLPTDWLLLDVLYTLKGFNADVTTDYVAEGSTCPECNSNSPMTVDLSNISFSANWVRELSSNFRIIAGGGASIFFNVDASGDNNSQDQSGVFEFGTGADRVSLSLDRSNPFFSGMDHVGKLRLFVRGGAEVRPRPQIGLSVFGNFYLTEHEEMISVLASINDDAGNIGEEELPLINIIYPRFTVDAALAFYF